MAELNDDDLPRSSLYPSLYFPPSAPPENEDSLYFAKTNINVSK